MDQAKKEAVTALVLVLIGLAVGGVVALMSVLMARFGDGWNAATISAVSLIAAPIAGFSWSIRRYRFGVLLNALLLLAGIVADFWLWGATTEHGEDYARSLWDHSPLWVLSWAVLFLSWQVLAGVAVVSWVKDGERPNKSLERTSGLSPCRRSTPGR